MGKDSSDFPIQGFPIWQNRDIGYKEKKKREKAKKRENGKISSKVYSQAMCKVSRGVPNVRELYKVLTFYFTLLIILSGDEKYEDVDFIISQSHGNFSLSQLYTLSSQDRGTDYSTYEQIYNKGN